ncbi:MAG: putative quinol monooxygenase [Candidatus Sulfotelmatobacter sp.]
MVVLAVTWMAKAGHEADVTAVFQKLTEQSRQEPGCAMYQVHRHKTESRRFFIYEQYKDDAALEAHRTAPHFQQLAKKDLPKVADRVEGHLFEPLG